MSITFDFAVWRNRPHHAGYDFIEDGIIDLDKWHSAELKILFLAKEAYGGTYDLRQEIRESAPYKNWYTVRDWTFAITHVLSKNSIPTFRSEDIEKWEVGNAWLRKIAFINVKKSKGKPSTDGDDLNTYVESDKDLLRDQIDHINPDVILCCYTFGAYEKIYGIAKENMEAISEWCLHHEVNGKRRLVINYWHFSGRYPRDMAYYALCAALMKYKAAL